MQPASDDCGHHGQQRTSVHARAVSGDGAAERSGCRIEICDHRIYHQGGRHWNGGISFGKVQLVQLIGVKAEEIEQMKNKTMTPAQLAEILKDGLTDYKR